MVSLLLYLESVNSAYGFSNGSQIFCSLLVLSDPRRNHLGLFFFFFLFFITQQPLIWSSCFDEFLFL